MLKSFCDYLMCPRRRFATLDMIENLELDIKYACYDKEDFEIKECVYLTPLGKIKEPRAPFLKDSMQVLATLIKIKKEDGVRV